MISTVLSYHYALRGLALVTLTVGACGIRAEVELGFERNHREPWRGLAGWET